MIRNKAFIIFFGALTSLALDQLSKFWVVSAYRIDESLSVVPGFFDISCKMNPGAAFGLFRGKPLVFFLVVNGIAILSIFYFFLRSDVRRRRLLWAIALIFGGALGNLSDRLFRGGAVVDFLDFHYKEMIWPTFNAADISIVAGVLLFLVDMSRHEMRADSRSRILAAEKAGPACTRGAASQAESRLS